MREKLESALVVAVYARYSDDSQSPMSIEDQIRRVLEHARRLGIEPVKVLKFTDEDMSGYKKRDAYARPGFNGLMESWDAGAFDVLLVDEFSRLGRNPRQLLEIVERLDDTRVRLICADGLDSAAPGSRLAINFKGIIAQEESRSTSHRVKRGMVGQLTRGFMMAPPSFGYRAERQFDGGRAIGTHWHVVEEEAKIVRRLYEMRSQGMAFDKIACWLNANNIETPRNGRIWRAAGVQRLLSNPIYRGEVVWKTDDVQSSAHAENGRAVTQVFERPHLRIVSDELWASAQSEKISRSGYGGGRSQYSGLIHCGHCENILSSTSKGRAFSCGSCGANRLAGDPLAPTSVPTISVAGLNEVLSFALERVLNDERIGQVHERLREKLAQGPDGELAELRKKHDRLEKAGQHLIRLICRRDQPDPLLEEEYAKTSTELRGVERQIKVLQTTQASMSKRDLAAQLDVDPKSLIKKLLDGQLPAERLRAVLSQLFPKFIFLGRESRYIARFEIHFAPGVAVAWLTETKPVIDECVVLRIKLIGSARRPVRWEVVEEVAEVGTPMCPPENCHVAYVPDATLETVTV